MNFHCFICKETFNLSKDSIKHLKRIHFLRDNTTPIGCIIIENCEKTFNTFRGLTNHVAPFSHIEVIQHTVNNIFFHVNLEKLIIILNF